MVSDIPLPWKQDTNTDDVFAWLRPLNEEACLAFNLIVESMIKNPDIYLHERKFIHVSGRALPRAGSLSESDDEGTQEEIDQSQIVGAFKFSTAVLPREPTFGWLIGTGFNKPEVDVVIGPSDSKTNKNKILGKHARLYIHKESCQTTVEALHGMEVTGLTGLKHIGPKFNSSTKVLENMHLVQFGRCTYVFEQGDAIVNGKFENSLREFMPLQHGPQWKAHPRLSAPSTADYHTLGGFTYLPGAFAGGTFGEVTVGWAQDGSAVAIKRFKQPNERKLDRHMEVMKLIGENENVMRLLHVSSNLQEPFPAIFCVYTPLALTNLEDVVKTYALNIPAQIALLIEYLRGLVYLHENKGIMHRDIKPNNLGVLSFSLFKGVILDLDSATTETLSDDDRQGTVAYLAPEVIDLKMDTDLAGYGRSVDIWALGMSFFYVLRGKHVMWNNYDDVWTKGAHLPETKITDFVLEGRLAKFHKSLGRLKENGGHRGVYVSLLERMTAYEAAARYSASQALGIAEGLAESLAKRGEKPVMPLRPKASGTKRKIGED